MIYIIGFYESELNRIVGGALLCIVESLDLEESVE